MHWRPSVKNGDLVRWTRPGAEAYGVVVRVYKETGDWLDGRISVAWQDGTGNGVYDPCHKYLELVSESR